MDKIISFLNFFRLIYKFILQLPLQRLNLKLLGVCLVLSFLLSDIAWARKLHYKEEFYRLYYLPQLHESQDLARNLHWLQVAVKAPFAPPIQALIPHENEAAYRKYQLLLTMHIHYLLTQNWVKMAARFDKHRPVFFNKPYAADILKSLDIAEVLYKGAWNSWQKTLRIFEKVRTLRAKSHLSFAETMIVKIQEREIDYTRVIARKLRKLEGTRAYFQAP